MKRTWAWVSALAVLAIVAVVLLLGYCTGPKWFARAPSAVPDKIRIGYMQLTPTLPLFVAVEKGLFKVPLPGQSVKAGTTSAVSGDQPKLMSDIVELTPFETANSLIEALATGAIDMGGVAPMDVNLSGLIASKDAYKFVFMTVSTATDPLDVLLVRPDSTVSGVKDLAGKKLGTFPGTAFLAYLKGITRNVPGLFESIVTIPLAPALQIQALMSGQVDALYTMEPFGTAASLQAGCRVVAKGLMNEYILPTFVGGAFCISSAFIAHYPEVAKLMVDTFSAAIGQIRANEKDARSYLPKYARVSEQVAQECGIGKVWALGEVDVRVAQALADFYLAQGILTSKIDVASALYKKP